MFWHPCYQSTQPTGQPSGWSLSATVFYMSVWGRGGKGIPRPNIPPGAMGCCLQGTQFLLLSPNPFPQITYYEWGGGLQQLSVSEAFYQGADSSLQGVYSLPPCSNSQGQEVQPILQPSGLPLPLRLLELHFVSKCSLVSAHKAEEKPSPWPPWLQRQWAFLGSSPPRRAFSTVWGVPLT